MVIVVTTSKVKPALFDEFEKAFKATVEGIFRQQDAWRSSRFAANPERTDVVLISHWEDAKAYQALVTTPAYMKALAALAPILESPPVVTIYESRFEIGAAPPLDLPEP